MSQGFVLEHCEQEGKAFDLQVSQLYEYELWVVTKRSWIQDTKFCFLHPECGLSLRDSIEAQTYGQNFKLLHRIERSYLRGITS